MPERLEFIGALTVPDRRLRQRYRLARAALEHQDLASHRAQRRPRSDGLNRVETLDETQAPTRLPEGIRIRPRPDSSPRAQAIHTRLLDGVPLEQPRRTPERVVRRLEQACRFANGAQRDQNRRPFVVVDVAETPRRCESALVELACLHVRGDCPGVVAGKPAVVPCLVAALRLEEMERERRRLVLRGGCGCLDRLRHSCVQLAPAAKGETLVGCLPNERVAKAQAAAGVGLDQLGESLPDCLVDLDPLPERGRKQLLLEPDAKDRGVPHHSSVGGREPIDLRGHHRFDRARQRVRRPGHAGDVEQLEQEQRAATRPLGDLLEVVGSKGLPVGRHSDNLGGSLDGEGQEREPERGDVARRVDPRRCGIQLSHQQHVWRSSP